MITVSILVLVDLARESLFQWHSPVRRLVSILVLVDLAREYPNYNTYVWWGRGVSILVLVDLAREFMRK